MAFSPCNEMWKLEALREKFYNNLKVELVLTVSVIYFITV